MNAPKLPVYALNRLRMGRDGEGVTTLAAVPGCPLRCRYRINPEARDQTAPAREFTPEELVRALEIDDLYFQATGGGVTFGGGEPLLRAPFLRAFAPLVKNRWKINIETSLCVPPENALVPADLYIVDIKDMRADAYFAYTGGDFARMRANLQTVIREMGAERVLARVPLIPGYNTRKDVENSVRALEALGVTRVDAFEYRLPAPKRAQSGAKERA